MSRKISGSNKLLYFGRFHVLQFQENIHGVFSVLVAMYLFNHCQSYFHLDEGFQSSSQQTCENELRIYANIHFQNLCSAPSELQRYRKGSKVMSERTNKGDDQCFSYLTSGRQTPKVKYDVGNKSMLTDLSHQTQIHRF